jgi:hypothetical protein
MSSAGDGRADAEEPKYFFVHLHKTAGTSLWRRMSRHFEPQEMFPNSSDGSPLRRTLAVDDLAERWPGRRTEVRVLAGHFPLCTADLLGERFVTLTLLRDPVDRILSALREQRQKLPEFATTPFEEIYAEPLRHALLQNHMTKMFSLTTASMTDGALTPISCGRDDLERAIEALESIDAVGFQEEFEPFCGELSRRFGWSLGSSVHDNPSRAEDVPQSVVEMITAENALDIELFEFARQHYRSS